MRNKLIFFISVLCVFSIIRSNAQTQSDYNATNTMIEGCIQQNASYKINEIISNDIFHTIYAERNDSLFMIISPMVFDKPHDSQEIKAGETYPLNLRQIYPKNDSIFGVEIMPIISKFNVNGIDVSTSGKYHYRIYKALNIRGIYLKNEIE